MIHSVKIKGYRAFTDFSMNGLGRINLLVGKNNTGKTSLLEALALLWAGTNLTALWQTLSRRGELPMIELISGRPITQEVEVSHFFTNHQAPIGAAFTIATTNEKPGRSIKYELAEPNPEENLALFGVIAAQEPAGAAMSLKISVPGSNLLPIPLTQRGSLRNDVFNQAHAMSRASPSFSEPATYIATESLSVQQLHHQWNDITLKPEEELVIRALRFIDGKIERIAPTTNQIWFPGFNTNRGGFLVLRKGEERIPIGSLGDGIWRILSLAISLSRTKGGLILIDEIDSGLHYSVMEQMWRFVNEVSKESKTQVFATTHSYDCVQSLAAICQEKEGHEITIQRIEEGQNQSIPFTEEEIKEAVQRRIEMR